MTPQQLKARLLARKKKTYKLSTEQVAALLERAAYGAAVADIAAEFAVDPETVRYHIRKACR